MGAFNRDASELMMIELRLCSIIDDMSFQASSHIPHLICLLLTFGFPENQFKISQKRKLSKKQSLVDIAIRTLFGRKSPQKSNVWTTRVAQMLTKVQFSERVSKIGYFLHFERFHCIETG
jgi:hypothetical protein